MSAPHFFLPSVDGDAVTLGREDARHAAKVLRIRVGETITVSDGAGSVVTATVTSADPSSFRADVVSRARAERVAPRLIVYPALPKSGKLESIIQKLVEIGADEIRPWPAARSVVRWDEAKSFRGVERWRAIAYEAAKQSRRAFLPVIEAPAAPDGFPSLVVVLHEEAETSLTAALPSVTPDAAGVIIGPEGGFEASEVAGFEAAGARTVTLGSQILRTETAAVVGPALVLARYGRLG